MAELLEQVLESDDSDLDDDLDDLCMEDEFFESADGVVAPFSKGQDGFCDYLYKVSTKQTPRQSSHSTAPIEGKDNTELDR